MQQAIKKALLETRVSKVQIKKYLEKRFKSQMAETIMKAFQFSSLPSLDFPEFCNKIDAFFRKD